jgi:FeS assembly protein IscX
MGMIGARMTPTNGENYTMRWTDVQKIAIALEEKYPDCDNLNLRFTDLRQWVLALDGFADDPDGCNEKILEAIQMAWIDERDA